MSTPIVIPFAEGEARLDWLGLTCAIKDGHTLPKAEIEDSFLYRGDDTILSRAAWIDGLGACVKTATVFPGNRDHPAINGGVMLFDDRNGTLLAIVDFHLVTKWKTCGDSLTGALRLARKDSRRILIVGAGTVARGLIDAYGAGFPEAQFAIWNRSSDRARVLADSVDRAVAVENLEHAVGEADIVATATMTTEPILKGDWVQPGTHLDLIGAYRPDMREVDDVMLRKSRIFVDSYDTTLGHIGELKIPLEAGVINREQVLADYYDDGAMHRESAEEITLFKNGGGAHMDLMTSRYVLDRWMEER